MPHRQISSTDVLKGALAGAAAGLAASFVMDRFQAAVAALSPPASGEQDEPATQKTADRIALRLTGQGLAKADKPLAGQAVHYALGTALGTAYGVAAEIRPAVAAGGGSAFGLVVAAVLDEALVPAADLGDAPWNTPASTHLYTGASHLVFGVTAELTRRMVRDALG